MDEHEDDNTGDKEGGNGQEQPFENVDSHLSPFLRGKT
jgi:hypothetical protein